MPPDTSKYRRRRLLLPACISHILYYILHVPSSRPIHAHTLVHYVASRCIVETYVCVLMFANNVLTIHDYLGHGPVAYCLIKLTQTTHTHNTATLSTTNPHSLIHFTAATFNSMQEFTHYARAICIINCHTCDSSLRHLLYANAFFLMSKASDPCCLECPLNKLRKCLAGLYKCADSI